MNPDLILVGGGLANSLIAFRLHALQPQTRILVIERDEVLGGNHTWSFHGSDVSSGQLSWLQPLISYSWPHYDILFPSRQRRLHGSYHSIFSEQFDRMIRGRIGDSVILNAEVAELGADGVTLTDGRSFSAAAVIDGRGDPGSKALDIRFQKFVGQVVQLSAPVDLTGPLLMDATIEQADGFRFMYTLPLGRDRFLIEDTRYSDTPALERDAMRASIVEYAAARDWRIAAVEREEEGALPVVLGGDLTAFLAHRPEVPRSGIRAGLFHYTTGYSLPEAVRLADDIAKMDRLASAELAAKIRARSFTLWRRGLYFRLLNRMLFLAGPPEERYRVLEHFYRLPEDLVGRFYAGALTWRDRVRILSGKPPVPVGRAIGSLFTSRQESVQ
ncbi:MAG: lycopene beta-cyclase CrtY [Gammaproteobacteria bacterium]|nr:lycopene beta-cyclase CrtY [Gammaproteobacteria bacterium]